MCICLSVCEEEDKGNNINLYVMLTDMSNVLFSNEIFTLLIKKDMSKVQFSP